MRTLGFLGMLPFVVASLACSTPVSGGDGSARTLGVEGPGALFYSVEAAATDAMAWAHAQRYPAGRPDLIAGTITRVDGGFSYAAPTASKRYTALGTPFVRFRLGPDDVASFMIYSRRYDRTIDRENEKPSRRDMRIVDKIDPEHRPIFVLTPTLRVVRYDGERIESIARLGESGKILMAAKDR